MSLSLIVICLDTFRADLVGPDLKMSYVATPNLDTLPSWTAGVSPASSRQWVLRC